MGAFIAVLTYSIWAVSAFHLGHKHTCSRICRPSSVFATGSSDAGNTTAIDPLSLLPQLYTHQKPRQKRRTVLTRRRKPRFYWQSPDNLRNELHVFWEELNVTVHPDEPPPIPSEYLLTQFDRNDLRWGVASFGGRENLSHVLGAKIVPGKWSDAVKLDEVKQLLPLLKAKDAGTNNREEPLQKDTAKTQHSHGDEWNAKFHSSTTNETLKSLVSPSAPSNETGSQLKEFWTKEKAVRDL